MLLNIILIIVGIAVVLWGADKLTEGAVGIAERMNIPQIVIGLTIVAMGTSMPEFCVSFVSALKGTPDLAVGNVTGSNIFNSMFIVGCVAAVSPMPILKSTVRKDIPFALLASTVLLMLCLDNSISRLDAGILLIIFAFFMAYTLNLAKNGKAEVDSEKKNIKPLKAVIFILLGLVCLIVGSNVFVDAATEVAKSLGISEAVIGLTIVAGGTSMPELATSLVAARKGNSGIAIGNVLGSNVFNILAILGITGVICPMNIKGITMVDFSMLIISMLLLLIFSFTRYTIARWEGILLAAGYVGYIAYLIY